MINTWGPDINYTPDYWPALLIIGVVIIVMTLAAILTHALLRLRGKKAETGVEEKFYLYTVPVRIWHWLNALLFIALLTTGFMNHFSLGSVEAQVKVHKGLGFTYLLLWLVFLVVNIVTGNGKYYIINLSGYVTRLMTQARYYMIGILRGEPHPYEVTVGNKFNPLQQATYVGVVYIFIPLLIITGMLCLFAKGPAFGLLKVHMCLSVIGIIFILVHVYMCTTGDKPADLVKGMVDGYHRHSKHS